MLIEISRDFIGHFEWHDLVYKGDTESLKVREICKFNSLAPVTFEWNFRLKSMSLDFTDDKSTLVQVMAWCHQATSHYLSQCWPRFMSPYGATGPQWVKFLLINTAPTDGLAISGAQTSAYTVMFMFGSYIYMHMGLALEGKICHGQKTVKFLLPMYRNGLFVLSALGAIIAAGIENCESNNF